MDKKIKICFFSPASYPFFEPESKSIHGGAEFQMYLLSVYLAKNPDFEILFIVGEKLKKKKNAINIKLVKGFILKRDENIFSKIIKAFRLIFTYIKTNPDIIITTTANSIVGISAFYKNIFRKKMIYRTASLIDVDKSWINTNGLTGKIFWYGLENADAIITQNKEHQQLVENNHKIKALVLKNTFPVQDKHQQLKKEFCLWISRFDSMKNPDLFLKLASQIPTEKFVMICPYNPSDYKKWMGLKQKAEIISNLTFIEKVPFHEIQPYFDRAKIFINTSDYEGFPNTFLQAAQGKTPIVSLNVNPDNFIGEYDCGYFCENKSELLLEKTKQLLQNPDEIKQKGKKAYLYLKENHDINKIGKQLEEIIYRLAEN